MSKRVLLGNILGQTGPQGKDGPRGPQGRQGVDGKNGVGVPLGGNANQVLVKTDREDYQTDWENVENLIIDDSSPLSNRSYSSSKVNDAINKLDIKLLKEIENSGYEFIIEYATSNISAVSGNQFSLLFSGAFKESDIVVFLPSYSNESYQTALKEIGGWTPLQQGFNASQPNSWKFMANEDLDDTATSKRLSVTALIIRKKVA